MFITFEGGDKAGKTTQIQQLKNRLEEKGYTVSLTREPGGTPIAERIRELLLDPANAGMEPLTEALLYAAARAQHVREVVRPALLRGDVVLCDRFYDSSVAYQAFGRELGWELIWSINREAMDGVSPDRTYLLSLPVEAASRRMHGAADRIEDAGEAFHQRVRDGYLAVKSAAPGRVMELDATLPVEELAKRIWTDVQSLLV